MGYSTDMESTTKFEKLNWPANGSDNAADFKYTVKVDGEAKGTIWQDEFTGPWTTDKGGTYKTRKAAAEAL